MKQTMYIGPDLKGIVRRNQIFTYYPENVIRQAGEVSPLTKHFFVPMGDVVTRKNELRRTGSFLNIAYQKIMKAGGRP
jgi:hypothetical protein